MPEDSPASDFGSNSQYASMHLLAYIPLFMIAFRWSTGNHCSRDDRAFHHMTDYHYYYIGSLIEFLNR